MRAPPSRLGWLAAGGIAVAVAVGLFLSNQPRLPAPQAHAPPPMPSMAAPPGGPAGLPVSTGPNAAATPREVADELFNAAMVANESGNAAELTEALPKALIAYRQLGPLDDDAAFHVALLQLTGRDFITSRATAEKILAGNPNHLLALSVAARAAAGANDAALARKYYERLVAAYDSEVGKPLPEYHDHARVLPIQREQAQAALGK